MRRVFELERTIDALFDFVFPADPSSPSERLVRGGIVHALGCVVPEKTLRQNERRDYFRIDLSDFLDFATSELSRKDPVLADFDDGLCCFFEGTDAPTAPSFTFGSGGAGKPAATAHILDCVIAREGLFVSITMRFRVEYQGRDGHMLITLLLARPDLVDRALEDPDHRPLEQWNKWVISSGRVAFANYGSAHPPWKIHTAGILTDDLIQRATKLLSSRPNIQVNISELESQKATAETLFPELIELARAGLRLPAYVRFMYDLVTTERVAVGERLARRIKRVNGKRKASNVPEIVYRKIRSIRVIHPEGDPVTRRWTPPSYAFAVRGHWRHYSDPTTVGHDENGNSALGKTWISDYVKNDAPGDRVALPTSTKRATPRVVIGIKQPLSYARDVISSLQEPAPSLQPPQEAGKPLPVMVPREESAPTEEWRAQERAKLTAGLRYLVLRRDSFTCQLCGKKQGDENFIRLEVDHKTPIDKWGRTVEPNLWTLCDRCNRGKGALDLARG